MNDIDESYRRASALDASRPSEATGRAVLAHAAQLASERAAAETRPPRRSDRIYARPRWRVTMLGSLAAAVFAGLLVTPHFLSIQPAPQTQPSPQANLAPPQTNAGSSAAPAVTANETAVESTTAQRVAPARTGRQVARATGANANATDAISSSSPKLSAQFAQAIPSPPVAGIPVPRSDQSAAMRHAAASGDMVELRRLFEMQVNLEDRDADGRTALMLAVLRGQREAVAALLAQGADPGAADDSGDTPMNAAIAGHHLEIAATLRRALAARP
jgi:Ankyrin repeats (3 copies)